jgi:hypothetical protein
MKAQDAAAAPAPVATPSPSVAESDEEKPAYTLSTALPPPERGLKGELRPSLVPDALAPAPPSPRPAPRLARPDESKRPAIADRAPVAQTAVIAEPTRPSSAARPTADARPAADARPVAGSRPVPGTRLAFDAPEQARLPTARRPEAAREEVKVAARTELPAVEALRQPPVPPIRPGAVERTARVTAGPAPTTSASRAPLAEPVTEPRSRLPRAGDEPAPRNIRRGGVAPRSDERLDGFPREFAQALREHNRRSATPRPDLDRPGGFPREFVQVLRDHNMAYSADPGGRRLGW